MQLHGAATARVTIPVGTKHPFARRFRLGAHLFFISESMRNQLLRLFAMNALLMVQLPGLLLNGG